MIELEEDISIKARKKLPPEVKKEINEALFNGIIISLCITLYFAFIRLGYLNFEPKIFIVDLKVFSVVLLAVSIILFEKGYKEDDERIFFHGIETLLIAFITLTMPYTLFYAKPITQIIICLSFVYYSIYYITISLIKAKKIKKQYLTRDIREIVKKENKEN